MIPGDLVLVPHGGERIGRVLARVRSVAQYTIAVEPWSPRARTFTGDRIVRASDCLPAPATDRRVKAVRKMETTNKE